MSSRSEARAHLAKAKEFFEAAQLAADVELYNAAASNAVTSGINAKDAICLALTGATDKADNHNDAVGELRRAGPGTKRLATTLTRLLSLKNKSQYQSTPVARSSAIQAVRWAQELLDGAEQIVSEG